MFSTGKDIYMSSHSTCCTDKDIYMSSHSTCLVQVKIYICPLILHVWYSPLILKIYIYVLSFYMFSTDKDIYMSSHSTCFSLQVQIKIYICPLILHV